MDKLFKGKWLLIFIIACILTSCSTIINIEKGMLGFLPEKLDSFRSFMKALLVIVLAQFMADLFIAICLIPIVSLIVRILYFIAIIKNTDYGFWMTALLFVIVYLLTILFTGWLNFLSTQRKIIGCMKTSFHQRFSAYFLASILYLLTVIKSIYSLIRRLIDKCH